MLNPSQLILPLSFLKVCVALLWICISCYEMDDGFYCNFFICSKHQCEWCIKLITILFKRFLKNNVYVFHNYIIYLQIILWLINDEFLGWIIEKFKDRWTRNVMQKYFSKMHNFLHFLNYIYRNVATNHYNWLKNLKKLD